MITLEPALRFALFLLYATSALLAAGHALLHRPDPRSAWGWIAVCWLAPVAGPLLYLLLGIDRVKIRARRAVGPPTRGPGAAGQPLPVIAGVLQEELRELVRLGGVVTGEPLTSGNRVDVLHNGEEAYPAMLEAIAAAQDSVCLETYIFEGARIGQRFATALAEAQARGVRVRVLIDNVGDFYYRPRGSKLLARHGVPVRLFQVSRGFPLPHFNLRNHRKLLIVDGRIAFTGGMNIGDQHMVKWKREPNADLHFRVEGPVVSQLSAVFAADWRYAAREALPRVAEPAAAGAAHCRSLAEGPNEDLDRLHMVLLGALANAHQRVRIMTPYFIPTPELSAALMSAAMRGVSIELMLPRTNNLPWLDWATLHWLPPLLAHGVRVLWRPPPFAHSKLFMVDHYYALVGSANLDPRSLRLNFELVLEVYDPQLCGHLAHHFDAVSGTCTQASLRDFRTLSLPVRLRNAFFWLFSPYL